MEGFRTVLALAFALPLVAGCSEGTTFTDPDDGGVDRGDAALTVRVEEAESERAAALGWTEGAVPEAAVELVKESGDGQWILPESITTSPAGEAVLEGLLPGRWRISGLRELTSDERETLGGAAAAAAFGGGGKFDVEAGEQSLELGLRSDRGRSLVISEWGYNEATQSQPGGDYHWFGYLELYNNADTTVHLDGKVVGWAYFVEFDFHGKPGDGCERHRFINVDPEGLWATSFQQFPGGGTEYTVAPGETVVLATDALDHSQVSPLFLDLSGADFEFTGSADADNPQVPNTLQIGLEERGLGHHGLEFISWPLMFISEPLDVDALARDRFPGSGREIARIPDERLLDVVGLTINSFSPASFCRQWPHPKFDRLPARWPQSLLGQVHLSLQRRRAGTGAAGQTLLLDTNTTQVDFIVAERTAGALPPRP